MSRYRRIISFWKRKSPRSIWLRIDRAMSGSLFKQVRFVLCIIAGLFLIFWGCSALFGFNNSDKPFSNPKMLIYLLIDTNAFGNIAYDDNKNIDEWTLGLATAVYLFGMLIFGGLLISILTNWYSKRVENLKNGRTSYLRSKHIIILGYDEIVPSIIQRAFKEFPIEKRTKFGLFRKSQLPYILLQSSIPCETVWEKLQRSVAYRNKNEKQHIVLSHGHRTSEEDLRRLNLPFAQKIYVVGDRCKSTHDSMNIESLRLIYKICCSHNEVDVKNIICVVEDDDTYSTLLNFNLCHDFTSLYVKLSFYNFYTEWVKMMFFSSTYGDTIKIRNDEFFRNYPLNNWVNITYDDNKIFHIVIVGINSFGVSIAIEAAKIFHFPNFSRDPNLKTKITFIDTKADEEMSLFMTRYKSFFEIQSCRFVDTMTGVDQIIQPTKFKGEDSNFLDVVFEFVKGDAFSPSIHNMLNSWVSEMNPLALFISFRDQQKGLSLALHLPYKILDANHANIFIRQTRSDAFITQLRNYTNKPYKNLYPFGMTDLYCDMSTQKQIQTLVDLLKYFEFDSETMNELLTEDFDNDSWEKIINEAHTLANQYYADESDNNRYLYLAYTIQRWENCLVKKDEVDSPVGINDFNDIEINYYLQTEHNRNNVFSLLTGSRKAGEYEKEYYKKEEKGETRKVSHSIRPYTLEDETKEKRSLIKLVPQMIRASHKVNATRHISSTTLHPTLKYDIEAGEYKTEWDIKENNGRNLIYDEHTGMYDSNSSYILKPKYDLVYDSETGVLKKIPQNLSAKIISSIKPKMILEFDASDDTFVEVPRNPLYRFIYKRLSKKIKPIK